MSTEGDNSVKARLFGEEHGDSVLKQVIKARLLRDLRQPTGGEDTDADSQDTVPGLGRAANEPVRIDRFVILRKLGQGGMGVVYAAFDEQLDRKIAIKLLRSELTDDERGRARMLREAQALARLSHPNVVQVHEVGRWRDHDFVAMEFIAGQTLDQWLLDRRNPDRPRPWLEVLAMLLQAGRGLAAAHSRDLIHRDFKPTNVMVGDDGRARVLDFGLARSVHERGAEGPAMRDVEETLEQTNPQLSQTGSSAFDRELTMTGAVLGTPAYMSPEQHLGRSSTVLSDQFGFCVVLYEALFGERPFRAKTRSEYAYQVIEGKFEIPGAASGVPIWLRKAVLRGLAPAPSDRWPSMDALLLELARERGRGWRVAGLAAGFAAVLAAGLLAGPSQPELCTSSDAALAGVWDDDRRTDLHDAFAGVGLRDPERTLALVEGRFDDFADQLTAARGEACQARWVRHEQTDAQLELRTACLDQRQREFEATIAALTAGDRKTTEHAVELLDGLGDIGMCEQVDLLERGWLVAKDADTAEQVAKLRGSIARANALRLAGDIVAARRIADEVGRAAASTDYLPLSAELLALRGRLALQIGEVDQAREFLREAATLAERVQHVELAPNAWISLMVVEGQRESLDEQPEQSIEYRMAESALRRLRVAPDDLRWAQLANGLAQRLIDADQPARAVAVLDRSLADLESRTDGAARAQRVWSLLVRGVALEALGQLDAAEQAYRASLELAVELHGRESIACADAEYNLGSLLLQGTTDLDEGVEQLERARAIYVRVGGPQSNRAVMADLAVANALIASDPDQAAALAERALVSLPPGHEDRSWALDAYAVIQLNRPDLDAADTAIAEAIAVHVDAGRSQHPDLAFMLTRRGELRMDQQRFADALADFEQASAIFEQSPDELPHDRAMALVGVGNAQMRLGESGAARKAFDRALILIGSDASESELRFHVAWGCAQSSRALDERDEGRRWAEKAHALLLELDPNDPLLNEISVFAATQ